MTVRSAIESGDVEGLRKLLESDGTLSDAPVVWGAYDELATNPLHFICDKLFDGTLSGEQADHLARVLVDAGADVDISGGDPLNAAASLGATGVGLLLLDCGAPPHRRGFFGETPLHWAAITGNAELTRRLLEAGAPVEAIDEKWNGTPLGWALHGWDDPVPGNQGRHRDVVAQLVRAGAEVDPQRVKEAESRGRDDIISALRGEL